MCLVCMAFKCWSSFEMSPVTCVWFVWHSSVGQVSKCHMSHVFGLYGIHVLVKFRNVVIES